MSMLKNKIALITGGANGIGKAAVSRFAEEGAAVVIADIDEKNGRILESDINRKGQTSMFLQCDVSKDQDVKKVTAEIEKRFGALHILYNNASVYMPNADGIITEIAENIWDKIININLKSIYLFCKYSIPLLIKSGGGSIINTSSSAGVTGIPKCDAYTAAKGATVSLTKSLAVEYGPKGLRVNCIAPAAIMTAMVSKSNLDNSDFDEERFLGMRTPMRRYGLPAEIAEIALFLASDRASYLNGAIIVADGGITINGDLAKLRAHD